MQTYSLHLPDQAYWMRLIEQQLKRNSLIGFGNVAPLAGAIEHPAKELFDAAFDRKSTPPVKKARKLSKRKIVTEKKKSKSKKAKESQKQPIQPKFAHDALGTYSL